MPTDTDKLVAATLAAAVIAKQAAGAAGVRADPAARAVAVYDRILDHLTKPRPAPKTP